MQPESKMKRRLDRAFDTLLGGDRNDSYRTAIEKGQGQRSGLPDRFYAGLGGHCWVEAKILPNVLSDLQEQVIQRLAKAGVRVVVISLEKSSDQLLVQEVGSDGAFCPSVRLHWTEVRRKGFWSMLLRPSSGSYHKGVPA